MARSERRAGIVVGRGLGRTVVVADHARHGLRRCRVGGRVFGVEGQRGTEPLEIDTVGKLLSVVDGADTDAHDISGLECAGRKIGRPGEHDARAALNEDHAAGCKAAAADRIGGISAAEAAVLPPEAPRRRRRSRHGHRKAGSRRHRRHQNRRHRQS